MKTLLVTNDFPPKLGGIQSYLHGLVCSLEPEEVKVLAPGYPGAAEFDFQEPYEIHRTPSARLYPTPALLERITRLSAGVDVVQFGYALQSWMIAPALRRRTGLPYVVFVHGAEVLMPLWVPGASGLLMRGTLGEATQVLSVSGRTAEEVARRTGGLVDCTVVYPIVDTERFRPAGYGAREDESGGRERVRDIYGLVDKPTILCVSRLVARKGQDLLIEAMPELSRRFGARLLLVGEGPMERGLRRRAARLGVESEVIFAGRVTEGELPDYYFAAEIFAMPARDRWLGAEREGFGVVYAEAAASGLPLVVGDSGGAREAVEDGETGYLVDGGSVSEVRKALERLLGNERLRRSMGEAARKRATALHGVEAVGARYRKALERAAGGGVQA